MYKFLFRSFLFFMAPLLWMVYLFVVDPYDYFNHQWNVIDQETKAKTAGELNLFIRTTIAYKNNPSEFLLVGDSRTRTLPISQINTHTQDRYTSLAIPAAKLNEVIELIYFAHDVKPLKHIITGVNFTMFNEYAYANRVGKMKNIINNPLLYIFNKPIAEASFYAVRGQLTGLPVIRKKPTRDEAWNRIMKERPKQWYGRYKYSDSIEQKITELSDFVEENNIRWTVLVVPHYKDFRDHLPKYNRQADEQRFLAYLKTLNADVIDYDFDSEMTTNEENFDDPVHYNHEIGERIIDEIWTRNFQMGRPIRLQSDLK